MKGDHVRLDIGIVIKIKRTSKFVTWITLFKLDQSNRVKIASVLARQDLDNDHH